MSNLIKFFLGLLIKLVLLLVWLSAPTVQAQRTTSASVSSSKNGKTSISIKNGRSNKFSLEYEGEISISDDDKDVTAISRGGYLEIKKSAFGNRRRIYIEPGSGGKLIKKYYLGSSNKNFEPEGRIWLAEILPQVLRSTTIGARERVDRIYKKSGTYGVLKEVGEMDSDYVKTTYIKLLLEKNPSGKNVKNILEVVGKDIDSDYHRADILKHHTDVFLIDEAATTAYIQAAERIDSDYHKADILKEAVEEANLAQSHIESLFPIAEAIDSDYHKADVLKQALISDKLSESGYKALVSTLASVDSDYHTAEVLAILLMQNSKGAGLKEALELTDHHLDSDYHKAQVLVKALSSKNLDSDNLQALLQAVRGLDSDSHRADVFKKMAKKNFDDASLIAVLETADSFDSDAHRTAALLALASKAKAKGGAVREAYKRACDRISSETYYGRAMKAVQ